MDKEQGKKPIKMIVTISLISILAIIMFWNQPVYRNYNMTTDKVTNGFTMVQLSDLHSTRYGKNQKRLIKKIDKANPDFIVLTGDIVDDVVSEKNAYILMKDLVTKYPLYYVDGNHEVWHSNTEKIYEEIEDIGVHILKNTYDIISVNGQDIVLAGIMDPAIKTARSKESKVEEELELTGLTAMDNNLYTILLSHRPEYFELYDKYPIDLVLAGHAHGGQVRIPFLLNGLYAPDQGLMPKHAGGYYQLDSYVLIVSRGLSLNIWVPRIFNPPEVVVISVNGGS